jgi:hypothetical protein
VLLLEEESDRAAAADLSQKDRSPAKGFKPVVFRKIARQTFLRYNPPSHRAPLGRYTYTNAQRASRLLTAHRRLMKPRERAMRNASRSRSSEERKERLIRSVPIGFAQPLVSAARVETRGLAAACASVDIKNRVSAGPTLSTDGKHKSSSNRMIDVYLIETQLYKDDAE